MKSETMKLIKEIIKNSYSVGFSLSSRLLMDRELKKKGYLYSLNVMVCIIDNDSFFNKCVLEIGYKSIDNAKNDLKICRGLK